MSEQDISHAAWRVGQAAESLAGLISSYHATWASSLKPSLTKDGDMWCALHGENLQVGISGFGRTPAEALVAFDVAMCRENGTHEYPQKGDKA